MHNCYFYRNGKLWKLTAVEDVKADKKEQEEKYINLPSFDEEDKSVDKIEKSLVEAKKKIDAAFAVATEAVECYKRCSAVYKELGSEVPASKKDAAKEVTDSLHGIYDAVWDKIDDVIGVCDSKMSDLFYDSPDGAEAE